MDDLRIRHMERLRQEGWTMQAIADSVGISRQRVCQIIGKKNIVFFKPVTKKQCVYVGLREWMNRKSVSLAELLRRIYGCHHPVTSQRYRRYLSGRNDMSMSVINAILEVTGLTYEQAFKREGNE